MHITHGTGRIRIMKGLLLAVSVLALMAFPTNALADGPNGGPPEQPQLQPGWAKSGTLHIVGPTVNAANPKATKTVDGPLGPITITSEFVPNSGSQLSGFATTGSGTCKSEFWQPSYRFTTYTPWTWDYSSVTWMGYTS